MIMKTYSLKKEEVQRNWFVVDATDRVLGRVATKIADKIRGKDKPTFTLHTDGGDYKLGKSMIKKLKVFQGPNHDHESQQPTEWNPS